MVGCVYLLVSLLVILIGFDWIDKVFFLIVVGLIVMVIGLLFVGMVVKDVMMNGSSYDIKYFGVVMVMMLLIVIFNMYLCGFMSLVLILLGIVCGYIIVVLVGIVDFFGVEKV